MKHHSRRTSLAVLLGLAMASAPAALMAAVESPYGTPAQVAPPQEQILTVEPGDIDRVVVIGPSTRRVSVTGGETVRFDMPQASGAKSFVWHFDTVDAVSFKLSEIAPASAMAGNDVTVYVADNPLYIGGGGG